MKATRKTARTGSWGQAKPREYALRLTGPQVLALSIGDKTQTRLPVHPSDAAALDAFDGESRPVITWGLSGHSGPGCYAHCADYPDEGSHFLDSPCGPGDRLWVQETWFCNDYTARSLDAARSAYGGQPPSSELLIARWREHLYYRAEGECCEQIGECTCSVEGSPWRSSSSMPRWASRFVVEVCMVSVARLLDITSDDLLAEGIRDEQAPIIGACRVHDPQRLRTLYGASWDTQHKRAPFSSNPWVWLITHQPSSLSQESGRGCIHQAQAGASAC